MTRLLWAALTVCLPCAATAAEPTARVLRLATAAPDGTAWAREFRAFSRDVANLTQGRVEVKWYFGGIAGDELEVGGRIRRAQLDGTAAAGPLCQQLAPTTRVTRVPGLFRTHDEATRVYRRLTPALTDEFRKHGLVYLGGPVIGADVLFSRRPIRTFDDLKRSTVWHWDLDEMSNGALKDMGLSLAATPLAEALATYDRAKADAMFALPTAALAFQWSSRASYFTELRGQYMCSCLVVANRAFDTLSADDQSHVRAAAAKAITRVDEVSRLADEQLLGGLFEKQGLKAVPPSDDLKNGWAAAAAEARRKLAANNAIPAALLRQVEGMLVEMRAKP
jgi:TRAP-type C4-dicarboxylate transport system substrate-binding protein